MRPTNPFECSKNHTFYDTWITFIINHIEKILKRHIKTSCMILVQNILILIQSSHKRAKTGLRPRFYLNCSQIMGKRAFWKICTETHILHNFQTFHIWQGWLPTLSGCQRQLGSYYTKILAPNLNLGQTYVRQSCARVREWRHPVPSTKMRGILDAPICMHWLAKAPDRLAPDCGSDVTCLISWCTMFHRLRNTSKWRQRPWENSAPLLPDFRHSSESFKTNSKQSCSSLCFQSKDRHECDSRNRKQRCVFFEFEVVTMLHFTCNWPVCLAHYSDVRIVRKCCNLSQNKNRNCNTWKSADF